MTPRKLFPRRHLGAGASIVAGLFMASLALAAAAFASGSTVLPDSTAQTPAWVNGQTVTVQYPQLFFCDHSVAASSSTGCEVGQDSNVGPVPNADRNELFVIVPLFANPSPAPMCPIASCPNHPLTIDLSRIAGALGTTPDAVANLPLPAHSHILAAPGGGWWDIKVVAVTNQTAWAQLAAGKNEATMDALLNTPGSGVVGPIPTNFYLFFNIVGS
ncbi:hypothetical protein SPF06_10005 [Sinomonas sp. JGH33]|uniref:Secreted protein n=1 Tax=Sinomonas terricola TaxID=3110330 RepID=A0ABU5T6C7_9MICC|nr:hypothetical protein [Sinomonas sp. JGH33]MEA5455051.1 hypothetical protein [Sinomonas sp. JGH33]